MNWGKWKLKKIHEFFSSAGNKRGQTILLIGLIVFTVVSLLSLLALRERDGAVTILEKIKSAAYNIDAFYSFLLILLITIVILIILLLRSYKKRGLSSKEIISSKETKAGTEEKSVNDDGSFFIRVKRKIVDLLLVLLTGEVPIDRENPKKNRENYEKEIRQTDQKRIELEHKAEREPNVKTKDSLLSKAFKEKEKFFGLKYDLLKSEQTKERRTFWRIVVAVYLVFFFSEGILSFFSFKILGSEMNRGLLLFIFQMLYTIASLRQVGETEIGALSFLSRFILNTGSGLAFVPLGICRISTVIKGTIVQELPDEAENIFETEKKEPVPAGKSAPMYIICGYPKGGELEDDPLHARLTGRATPVVTYRVINPCDFFSYVGSLKEARRRMTDVASAMLGTEIAKTTYSEVIGDMAKYNKVLSLAITRKIDGYSEINSKPWGLHFEDAWLKPFLFGHGLHKSMALLVESKFKKEATIIDAEADKQKVVLSGEATSSVIKNEADALTGALLKRKADLKVDSELVYVGEVAEKIAEGNTVLLGTNGFKEVLGLSKVIADTMKDKKKQKGDGEK